GRGRPPGRKGDGMTGWFRSVLRRFLVDLRLPPGFVRCRRCGEFNGTTRARYLNTRDHPSERISVLCLCGGIPCRRCGKNRIHRPISNTYHEEDNSVWHTPWFASQIPCEECRLLCSWCRKNRIHLPRSRRPPDEREWMLNLPRAPLVGCELVACDECRAGNPAIPFYGECSCRWTYTPRKAPRKR
ncbi:MAG: hypothetical protein ACREIU_15975, partial [Planctomycetota bacterium]